MNKLIIKIFIIVVLLILNIAIYINGKDLTCGKCTLNIKIIHNGLDKDKFTDSLMKINITDIYNDYLNKSCYYYEYLR